jgi:hypothetical protein
MYHIDKLIESQFLSHYHCMLGVTCTDGIDEGRRGCGLVKCICTLRPHVLETSYCLPRSPASRTRGQKPAACFIDRAEKHLDWLGSSPSSRSHSPIDTYWATPVEQGRLLVILVHSYHSSGRRRQLSHTPLSDKCHTSASFEALGWSSSCDCCRVIFCVSEPPSLTLRRSWWSERRCSTHDV